MYHNSIITRTRENCGICGCNKLVDILDLPSLPLTGIFSNKKPDSFIKGINQKLLWCPKCGQGQLFRQIDPYLLYDFNKYCFRTSASINAREGTDVFLGFLKKLIGGKILNYAIDVGCNDLYLLNEITSFTRQRLGVDPMWRDKNPGSLHSGTTILGKTIEEIDFHKDLLLKPDIILCRHTIEHIYDPCAAIGKLMELADRDTLFVFETHSFETLVERCRFDQVFHEHLQYFSPATFEHVVNRYGGKIVAWTENHHNWGSMIVAFKKNKSKDKKFKFGFKKSDIEKRILLFRKQMDNTSKLLQALTRSDVYGYGAAAMLPILAYHLKTDFSFLKRLLDDDIKKDGLYYANLPLRICNFSKSHI